VHLLPEASLAALTGPQFGSLTPSAVAAITTAQLRALGADTCSGFKVAQVAALTGTAGTSVCAGFQDECLDAVSLEALEGLSADCLGDIDAPVLAGLSLTRLHNLPAAALSGLLFEQFAPMFLLHSVHLIDAWSVAQGNALSKSVLHSFKAGVLNGSFALEESWSASTNFTFVSGVRLADAPTSALSFLFASATVVDTLPENSWIGLRSDQVRALGSSERDLVARDQPAPAPVGADTIGSISWLVSATAWSFVQWDALGALSKAQVASLVPAAFAGIDLSGLSETGLQAVSTEQMAFVPLEVFASMSCESFLWLTTAQTDALIERSVETYNDVARRCGGTPIESSSTGEDSSSSSSGDDSSSSSSSSSGPDDSSSTGDAPASGGDGSSGLSNGAKAGIACGAAAGGVLLIALVVYLCGRCRGSLSSRGRRGAFDVKQRLIDSHPKGATTGGGVPGATPPSEGYGGRADKSRV
jgi:hypothetical protein